MASLFILRLSSLFLLLIKKKRKNKNKNKKLRWGLEFPLIRLSNYLLGLGRWMYSTRQLKFLSVRDLSSLGSLIAHIFILLLPVYNILQLLQFSTVCRICLYSLNILQQPPAFTKMRCACEGKCQIQSARKSLKVHIPRKKFCNEFTHWPLTETDQYPCF